ncbi:Uncharacterized protein DAT39_008781, partial [Clarias magur]
ERGRRSSILDLHSIATSWRLGYLPNLLGSPSSSAASLSIHMGRKYCTHLSSAGLHHSSSEGK